MQREEKRSGAMYNILVVDDEKIHRKGIVSLLEEFCPQDMFWEAVDGMEAMEVMRNVPCEIVISDIRMAKMDGLALLRQVKEVRPEVFFIIISGYADFSYAKEAVDLHASAYLLKPVDRSELEKTIIEVKADYEGKKARSSQVTSMEKQLKKTVPVYMEWLLNQYIACNREEEWEPLDRLFPMHKKGFLMLMRIRESGGRMSEEKRRNISLGIKKRMEPDSSIAFSVNRLSSTSAVLVLGENRPDEGKIRKMIEWINRSEKIPTENIYISISFVHEDMHSSGAHAFSEAYAALKWAFYEDCHILWADDCREYERGGLAWNMEPLLNAIREGKTELAETLYEELLKEARQEGIAPEILKRRLTFLFFRILRNAEPFIEQGKIPEFNERNHQIMEVQWYGRLMADGKRFIFEVMRSLQELRNPGQINPIEKCREYLETNYMEEISLDTAAGMFHFNPSYFSTLFKQNFGTSFSEYLSSVRMRKAMELLRDRSYKVKQIALLVGYKDPNYFIRSFKKKYGVTPDEFRKRGV